MTRSCPSLPLLFSFLCCSAHVLNKALTAHACTFPAYLQWQEGDEEFNWHTRIRNGRNRESAYSIRHNVIDVRHSTSSLKPLRWKCALTYHNKFLVRRMDPDTAQHYSACVKFIRRSSSIVQMMWSKEGRVLDPLLCDDKNLSLDPWPLVSFKFLMDDYTPSPFHGGFSMRITDSETGENGCNYMHRPMKFESDCLTGEGVIFDFISQSCTPDAGAFFVRQRTLPVTSWDDKGQHYVILRRKESRDLFCLRIPASGEKHMNAFLFTDLACLTEKTGVLLTVPPSRGVRYLVLHLHRYIYRRLCDDEYPQCAALTCNNYIRHECQKSCGVCQVNKPPPTCSFPRRFRGRWRQTDIDGTKHVNITDTDLAIDKVGSFRCVMYPDSPQRKTRMYTTVSMFQNGCRPRYSCIKLKKLGPSVMRYTLSRSSVWPNLERDFGQAICAPKQFGVDPEPVNDLYRSLEDTGKPLVSDVAVPERVPCNLSSSYTLTATLPDGSQCRGNLFELCEDPTRLRFQFHPGGCGESFSSFSSSSSSSSQGYFCLADFEGHYWERVLMLQSEENVEDVRCLLFTQLDASAALVMVSGQCDKNSWNYVRAGLREPLMSLQLQPEEFPCRYLPKTTPTPTTTAPTPPHPHHHRTMAASSGRHGSYHLKDSHRHGSSSSSSGFSSVSSFTVNVTPSSRHSISASYEEPQQRGRGETFVVGYDNQGLSPAGNQHGGGSRGQVSAAASGAARISLGFHGAAMMVMVVVLLSVAVAGGWPRLLG
ncbi:uncharacterized protein LOC143287842 [Babylonia areolata]|uniref:uncharacterized protein LOC143287842 n=1 Tax=Babylonia areolata TaxID=304850 RepID=UPI003FD4247B